MNTVNYNNRDSENNSRPLLPQVRRGGPDMPCKIMPLPVKSNEGKGCYVNFKNLDRLTYKTINFGQGNALFLLND
jgi:hypothetical protein